MGRGAVALAQDGSILHIFTGQMTVSINATGDTILLKRTVQYKDFDNQPTTEDLYFNLSKPEVIELEAGHPDGYGQHLRDIVSSGNGAAIVAEFKELILKSYGKKSNDGKRFIKTPEMVTEFQQTAAYDTIFMEICTSPEAAAEFFNAIMPEGLEADVERMTKAASGQQTLEEETTPTFETVEKWEAARNEFHRSNSGAEEPEYLKKRVLTKADLLWLNHDQLRGGLADGKYVLS